MKFLFYFTLFTLLFLALIEGLVISVDPYDKLGINLWQFKTKAVAQSRESKYLLLEKSDLPYEVFLLGSSAAHRYPMTKLKELTGHWAFNYSAQHTNPEDYLAILRHILTRHRPKMVLLQLDFIEMNAHYATSNQLYSSPLVKYLRQQNKSFQLFDNNYFTLEAISDSLRVIYVNLVSEARHNNYLEHGDYKFEKPSPGKVKLEQASYQKYELSQERLDYLKEIKDLCLAHKIELVVFTAPLSYEHFIIASSHSAHPEFLKAITQIFGQVYNFQHASIKNYSTYNDFHSSAHMTHFLSAKILERLFTGLPSDLGEVLGTKNSSR
jgi:hypothetical protein